MTDPKTTAADKPADPKLAPTASTPVEEPPPPKEPTPEEALAKIGADLTHSNYPDMREHIHVLHDLLRRIVTYLQIPVEASPPPKEKDTYTAKGK